MESDEARRATVVGTQTRIQILAVASKTYIRFRAFGRGRTHLEEGCRLALVPLGWFLCNQKATGP